MSDKIQPQLDVFKIFDKGNIYLSFEIKNCFNSWRFVAKARSDDLKNNVLENNI
jgi:hypothetical protein